ncbi:DUF4832 domain-containing protein [Ktedonosporobacter rubrisoli]|uniref:DUF4832 domain-containing protein n=1 Tax=Ktedonosporobacter rubrisoli TaxID=2509675 RepID=A0A4P6JW13_KTERU|nr:DUF4832 domain-containing protein [Ktedonosporobacter rubrisoli]QBD79583.1 DUF4832 domain-containing protein [Ktedonosporobacter rubrisoli]
MQKRASIKPLIALSPTLRAALSPILLSFLVLSIFWSALPAHAASPSGVSQEVTDTLPVELPAQASNYSKSHFIKFTPKPIPLDAPEIGNPLRGAQYYGGVMTPPNLPLTDLYGRFCWNRIEPKVGQFDFSRIDEGLAEAKAAGYTYGFRVMPYAPEHPDCLPVGMKLDFNSPEYMANARALFTALAQRYADDPRLNWMDMSLYGCWGEWHLVCDGAENITPMTLENQKALIDMEVQLLPKKTFFMLTDNRDAARYAVGLNREPRIGIRLDCLGTKSIGGGRQFLDELTKAGIWRNAPIRFEYCMNPDFKLGLDDTIKYHASMIGDGDGNLLDFNQYTPEQQALLVQTFKSSGYRYELNNLYAPQKLIPGWYFPVVSLWSNVNTAPVYNKWKVQIQLRDAQDKIAWQDTSSLDLHQLLPKTETDKPGLAVDVFKLPDTIPSGSYTLTLQIVDANGYYQPLKLAIEGIQPDGSYPLGKVTV